VNACVLPHWTVAAIAVVPGGAHPSYAHGYYARDKAAYLAGTRLPPIATASPPGWRRT